MDDLNQLMNTGKRRTGKHAREPQVARERRPLSIRNGEESVGNPFEPRGKGKVLTAEGCISGLNGGICMRSRLQVMLDKMTICTYIYEIQ